MNYAINGTVKRLRKSRKQGNVTEIYAYLIQLSAITQLLNKFKYNKIEQTQVCSTAVC